MEEMTVSQLAQLAGVEPPRNIDGISFLPTLLSEPGQKQHDLRGGRPSGFITAGRAQFIKAYEKVGRTLVAHSPDGK